MVIFLDRVHVYNSIGDRLTRGPVAVFDVEDFVQLLFDRSPDFRIALVPESGAWLFTARLEPGTYTVRSERWAA